MTVLTLIRLDVNVDSSVTATPDLDKIDSIHLKDLSFFVILPMNEWNDLAETTFWTVVSLLIIYYVLYMHFLLTQLQQAVLLSGIFIPANRFYLYVQELVSQGIVLAGH